MLKKYYFNLLNVIIMLKKYYFNLLNVIMMYASIIAHFIVVLAKSASKTQYVPPVQDIRT